MTRLFAFVFCLTLLVGCDSAEDASGSTLFNVVVETPSGTPVGGLALSMEYALGAGGEDDGEGNRTLEPARLRYFDVYVLDDGRFRAEWETEEEAEVARFVVEGGPDEDDLGALRDLADVAPHGAYTPYTVEVEGDLRLFRLRIEDADGGSTYSIPVEPIAVAEEDPTVPSEVSLGTGYPNPFFAATTLTFALSEAGDVAVEVFDLEGRPVIQREGLPRGYLLREERVAGVHTTTWDASDDLVGGFYHVRLTAGEDTASVLAVYTARATGPQGVYRHVRTELGQTDENGRLAIEDRALFPQLYAEAEAEYRSPENVLLGFFRPSENLTLVLKDGAGREQRYERVLTGGSNTFTLTWSPE